MQESAPLLFSLSFLLGFVLGLVFLAVSRLTTPPRRVGDKNIVYESGARPFPSRLHYLAEKYFPFIVVYVLFDTLVSFIVSILYYSPSDMLSVLVFSFFALAALAAANIAKLTKWR